MECPEQDDKTGEEKHGCELQQDGEGRDDHPDAPLEQSVETVLPQPCALARGTLHGRFMESLLHEQGDGGGCEAEHEAGEPQCVEPDRGRRCMEGGLYIAGAASLTGGIDEMRRNREAAKL